MRGRRVDFDHSILLGKSRLKFVLFTPYVLLLWIKILSFFSLLEKFLVEVLCFWGNSDMLLSLYACMY